MGILDRIEQRGSLENPSTSLADADVWLMDALGGGETASGKRVNHKNALKLSAVWAATKVISEDVAKLPLVTYRRLTRGKERASTHPIFRVLHTEFNREMSAYNGRRTLQAHVLNWGDAFAEIERNGAGDIIGLWPLLPDRTHAARIAGRKVIVTRVGGEDIPLDARSVLHIPGLGFDGLRGYSVIGHARQAIGTALAAEEFGAKFFGSGAVPSGIITRKDALSEPAQQRLRGSWNKVHGGLSGAQRVAILDEGMEYEKIGIPPEDAQFISTRQYGVEDIIRFYRVPPHKVQHLIHAGVRANVEAENISYVTDTLQSWLVGWEQEINRTLFAESERSELFAEHILEGLLRGDSTARSQFYQSGINNGWLMPNEVREMENRNPVEGGDRLYIALNLVPLDSPLLDEPSFEGSTEENAAPTGEARAKELRARRSATERWRLQQTHMPAFASAVGRVIRREVEAVEEIMGRTLGERAKADFLREIARFYETFPEVVERELGGLTSSYAELVRRAVADELGVDPDTDARFDGFVDDYTQGMAARHVRKSLAQLEAIVAEGEEEDDVLAALEANNERWTAERPEKVALSETVRAGGAFAKTAYGLMGAAVLRWVTVGDSCPFCRRMNGRSVGVRENFVNQGDTVDPEGDDEAAPMTVKSHVGHPPLHASCDCVVVAG